MLDRVPRRHAPEQGEKEQGDQEETSESCTDSEESSPLLKSVEHLDRVLPGAAGRYSLPGRTHITHCAHCGKQREALLSC